MNEETVKSYEEEYHKFIDFLANNTSRIACYARKRTPYLHDLQRIAFQRGKVIEEIGEFIQSVSSGKWCGALTYPSARGTIESEGADVIIAAVALSVFEGVGIVAGRQYDIEAGTEKVNSYLRNAMYTNCPSLAILAVYAYLRSHGIDVASHVAKRVAFNEGLS